MGVRQMFYEKKKVSKSIEIKRKYINNIPGIILEVRTRTCPGNVNEPLYKRRCVRAKQTSKELPYKVL